jgi:cell division protein FtsB
VRWRGPPWPGGSEQSVPPGFPGSEPADPADPAPDRSEPSAAGQSPEVRCDEPDDRADQEEQVQGDLEEQPRPTPRRARPSRLRARPRRRPIRRAVERIGSIPVAFWPGLAETSVPSNFLGARTTVSTPRVAILPSRAAAAPGVEPQPRTGRRLPPGLRLFGSVVGAVYAALADPLVGADEAARERRAAQIRRAGMLAAGGALTAVFVYSIFPVRTYLDQRAATQRARERLEIISQENERLADQAEELRDPETVEEIARRDYGLVLPGEESYGVLPPPEETTTTAPTTTTTVPRPP